MYSRLLHLSVSLSMFFAVIDSKTSSDLYYIKLHMAVLPCTRYHVPVIAFQWPFVNLRFNLLKDKALQISPCRVKNISNGFKAVRLLNG